MTRLLPLLVVVTVGVVADVPASAGTCQIQTRTYCVVGTSTPLDWTWDADGSSTTVLAATNGLLGAGDPASAIVALFVTEIASTGLVVSSNTPNTCAQCASCFDGFDLESCTQLSVNSTIVPAGVGLSFNPVITLPEPTTPPMLLAGAAALVGLRRRRRTSPRRSRREQEARS